MIKKSILISFVMIAGLAFSQQKQIIANQMHQYTVKIDSIVTSEKEKMSLEMRSVENDLPKNSDADMRKKKKSEIAEKYEQIINEKIAAQRAQLDSATKEVVREAVLNPNSKYRISLDHYKGILNVSLKKEKEPKDYLRSIRLNVSWVTTSFTSKNEPLRYFNDDTEFRNKVYNSSLIVLYYNDQIGGFKSPFSYRIGLGLRVDGITPKYDKVFTQDQNNVFIGDFTRGEVKKKGITNAYITLPVDLRFVLNPKYITYNGVEYLDNRKDQFYVSAGIYGAWGVGSTNFVNYSNEITKRNIERNKIEHGFTDFLVGGRLGLGYGGFGVFVQKDFNPIFTDSALVSNKYGLQFGIEFVSIQF